MRTNKYASYQSAGEFINENNIPMSELQLCESRGVSDEDHVRATEVVLEALFATYSSETVRRRGPVARDEPVFPRQWLMGLISLLRKNQVHAKYLYGFYACEHTRLRTTFRQTTSEIADYFFYGRLPRKQVATRLAELVEVTSSPQCQRVILDKRNNVVRYESEYPLAMAYEIGGFSVYASLFARYGTLIDDPQHEGHETDIPGLFEDC